MVTAESLAWLQSLGLTILQWDSFLLGAVFLTMNIDADALDDQLYPKMLTQPQQYRQGSRSSSNSNTSTSKKVTFDEQVLVLEHGAQRGLAPIFTHGVIDPHMPLSESPTRSSFRHANPFQDQTISRKTVLAQMQQEEAEYHLRMAAAGSFSPVSYGSPSSSRSGSCRSSICSVSSDSSDKDSKHARSTASSRIAALFHPHAQHRAGTDAAQSISEKKISGGKNLVHRIMHPQQHKREQQHLQQQQQLPHQAQLQPQSQPQPYLYEQHCAQQQVIVPEALCCSATSSDDCDCEYQPLAHSRKTLIQRLGLKKKRSL
ncbi:hypothetical protein EC968_004003 [Mortierella alpina]|nr:hypothetical protein EC968_004003 [Mortierella alpina]